MRTQRIEKVFHLIGVAVAALSIATGLSWHWFHPTNALDVISIFPNAVASYAFMWGFGWMLARFGSDGEDLRVDLIFSSDGTWPSTAVAVEH